jgi:hypothetical protein
MSRRVLGTDRDSPEKPALPGYVAQSHTLYQDAPTVWFRSASEPSSFKRGQELRSALQGLTVDQLSFFEWPISLEGAIEQKIPLGALALPALRWVLRRHHLPEEETVRFLLQEYICSAYHVAMEFSRFLTELQPSVVVVFNGQFFPERRRLGYRDSWASHRSRTKWVDALYRLFHHR